MSGETVIEISSPTIEVVLESSPTVIEVGTTGLTGPQGLPGADGTDGQDGADGADGPNLINSSTATTFNGLLLGDGSFVSTATIGSGLTLTSGVLFSTPVSVITAHSSLTGLDYASAGHTGFQSTITFPLLASLGGTGVNNTGTLTNESNTIISGGGTLSLGGFTATVPATLTIAGLGIANVFTRVQFIDGTADEIQLRVQAHSSQTASIQTWEDSTGTALALITQGGGIWATGNLTVASATSAKWRGIRFQSAIATVTGATAISDASGFNYISVNRPTISAASALTVTHTSTLYIEHSPLGSGAGPATVTNAYAIWVDDGNVRFDGVLGVGVTPAVAGTRAINAQYTALASSNEGVRGTIITGLNFTNLSGINGIANIGANNNTTESGTAQGIISATRGTILAQQARTISEMTSLMATLSMDAGPTITTWHGLLVTTPFQGATPGTITTANGVYIEDQTIATINYAFFSNIGKVSMLGSTSVASASGATWNAIELRAATATITGSTNITTAAGFNYHTIARPTLSAASALTVTNSASLYIANSPVGAGAGPATITNAYSLWVDAGVSRFDGNMDFTADGTNFVFGTGTGVKIGTSTSQKIAFWNATPIVQPTTAISAATFVANTSGIANDTATFGGYTLGQVVQALRNAGLLA